MDGGALTWEQLLMGFDYPLTVKSTQVLDLPVRGALALSLYMYFFDQNAVALWSQVFTYVCEWKIGPNKGKCSLYEAHDVRNPFMRI